MVLTLLLITTAMIVGLLIGFLAYMSDEVELAVTALGVGSTVVVAVVLFGPMVGAWTLYVGYFGYGLAGGVVAPITARIIASAIEMRA